MGESVSGIVNQSGVLTKNYLVNWNIAGSSAWDKALVTDAVQSETDPFGGTTAYSFTGFLYGADVFGVGGLDTVAGSTLEYVCWVKGTGSLQLSDSTIGKIMLYFVDTPYWQRVVMRTTRVAGQATGDGINITLTPDTAHSLHIWRPGIYAEFNSIDSRPSAISGAYEGADIGYAEYNYIGGRERNSIIVYGAAAPTTGTWAVGDKVINTVPASLGYSGWVCTTAGLIGAGAVFSGYGAIA
jgi:hypothetical protein